jgi:hypothetical protein
MLGRSGNPIALPMTPVATTGMALTTLMIAASAGWPQAASPPSSASVEPPAQQAVPDQPPPQRGLASRTIAFLV